MQIKNIKVLLIGDYSLDAIDYYLNLVEKSLSKTFKIEPKRIFKISEIEKYDLIVTIDAKSSLKVWLVGKIKRLKLKIINWYQGVVPEEAFLVFNSPVRKFYWEVFEKFCLRNADFNIFVSHTMHQHYEKKYRLNIKSYFIIPCYNKRLERRYFENQQRYLVPSFVYAGSLSKWQCVEEIFCIFQMIEKHLPNATLTVLTKEQESAKELADKYDLKNVKVRYVAVDELDKELANFKYGFLIRKPDVVNHVATPTKMNSYLAIGIIPVFTNVVGDFEQFINLKEYSLKLDSSRTMEEWEWVKEIIRFETEHVINGNEYYKTVSEVFDSYYNDEKYISKLSDSLILHLK